MHGWMQIITRMGATVARLKKMWDTIISIVQDFIRFINTQRHLFKNQTGEVTYEVFDRVSDIYLDV